MHVSIMQLGGLYITFFLRALPCMTQVDDAGESVQPNNPRIHNQVEYIDVYDCIKCVQDHQLHVATGGWRVARSTHTIYIIIHLFTLTV